MQDHPEPLRPHTRIRATCPSCGEVELLAPDVTLKRCGRSGWTAYSFICPDCGHVVTKQADERVSRLLVSGGVRIEREDLPAEVLERHDGPPLTYDDLLDLHLLLESPGWWVRLAPPE